LENVLTIIGTLILGEGEEDDSNFRRGDVWNVKLSGGNQAKVLILHSNAGNAMAMTMTTTNKRRNRSRLVLPIQSDTSLEGYSVLVSQVRSLSTECRFLDRVGRMTAREVDEAGRMLIRLLSPMADT
jgi:mRNA-degrading endonuclease toxin of MazEF toxin-antitoxin module